MNALDGKEIERENAFKSIKKCAHARKSLGIIQPVSNSNILPKEKTGKNVNSKESNAKLSSVCNSVSHTETDTNLAEAGCQTTCHCACHCCAHNTSSSDDLCTKSQDAVKEETETSKYWEETAESYRKALHTVLLENETLHRTVDNLRIEYDKVSQQAENADQYSKILKAIIEDAEDTSESDSSVPVRDF